MLNFSEFEIYRSQLESAIKLPNGYLWIPYSILILGLSSLILNRIYRRFLAPVRQIADDCARGGLNQNDDYNQNRETRIISNFIKRLHGSARENGEKAQATEIALGKLRKELNEAVIKIKTLESLVDSNARVRERLNSDISHLRREHQRLSQTKPSSQEASQTVRAE